MVHDMKQSVAILAARSTIGQAVSRRLGEMGAQVALIGRELSGVRVDATRFSAECDLADFDAVENALDSAREAMRGLTGIVNCAGSMLLKSAHLTTREEFNKGIEANLATAFAAVRAAARQLGDSGGSVVLLSSAAATLGMTNHDLIRAAKAGVEGLVGSAAATYAGKSIRVNAVAPGLVYSKLSERLLTNRASRKISEALHPLTRIGSPDEIASAICWLLHPEQSWVTGQVIGVDGGLSRVQPRPKIELPKR